MTVKTLTAPSINAALQEARRLYGDDVVLLESVAGDGHQPARITVMLDEQTARAAARQARPAATAALAPSFGDGFADGLGSLTDDAADEPALPRFGYGAARPTPPGTRPVLGRRDRVFQAPVTAPAPVAPAPAGPDVEKLVGRALEQHLGALLDGLKGEMAGGLAALEARVAAALGEGLRHTVAGAVLGQAQRWAAHPVFAECLQAGLRPVTASALFAGLADDGLDPDALDQPAQTELRWALARHLRDRLAPNAPPRRAVGTVVLVGPSGAGKTALALKLARNRAFFGRRKAAVIAVVPESGAHVLVDPAAVYGRFGVPAVAVRTPEHMAAALEALAGADTLLIDTPALPAGELAAHRMLLDLQRILEPVMPYEVHLVLNATRSLDGFDASMLGRWPLRPDALALTGTDETAGWGRVAEWLMAFALPTRFVSTGPAVPADLAAFSPAWFVEEAMGLGPDAAPAEARWI